jgi:cell fate regulator YaaT (PSP1 superfamily)
LAVGEPAGEPEAEQTDVSPAASPLKAIYRLATAEDLAQAQSKARLENEAYAYCQERIAARKLDMNLVKVNSILDRSRVIFYFTTAEGRLDFRELVKDLVVRFRTRVELRQIGVRHEAKLLGGIGSCGRELCCATFLKDFVPVSVKMAKEQNLSLNPTKISGLCGRLMCCLTYEYETYRCLKKELPKPGKKVPLGSELVGAKVIRQNVLERKVTLLLPDGREATVTPEEIAALAEELRNPPQPPPRAGRSRPAAHPSAQQTSHYQNQQQAGEQTQETGGKGGSRGRGRRRSQKGPNEK